MRRLESLRHRCFHDLGEPKVHERPVPKLHLETKSDAKLSLARKEHSQAQLGNEV